MFFLFTPFYHVWSLDILAKSICDIDIFCLDICYSVAKLCLILCNPRDCNMPGFPVLHYLLEFAQTHPLSRWCHPIVSSSVAPFSCPQSFSFQWVNSSHQVAKVLELHLQHQSFMNIQCWFPLGFTDLISLLYKGLSRVFSNTTVRSINSSALSLLNVTLTSIHDYWENHSFDFVGKVVSLLFNTLSRFVIAFLQAVSIFQFHGCSYHLQWFWSPRK